MRNYEQAAQRYQALWQVYMRLQDTQKDVAGVERHFSSPFSAFLSIFPFGVRGSSFTNIIFLGIM